MYSGVFTAMYSERAREWAQTPFLSHTGYTKLSSMLLQSKKESTRRGWTSCWKSESCRLSGQTPASLRSAAWGEREEVTQVRPGSAQGHVSPSTDLGSAFQEVAPLAVNLSQSSPWSPDTLVMCSFWSSGHYGNLITWCHLYLGHYSECHLKDFMIYIMVLPFGFFNQLRNLVVLKICHLKDLVNLQTCLSSRFVHARDRDCQKHRWNDILVSRSLE